MSAVLSLSIVPSAAAETHPLKRQAQTANAFSLPMGASIPILSQGGAICDNPCWTVEEWADRTAPFHGAIHGREDRKDTANSPPGIALLEAGMPGLCLSHAPKQGPRDNHV